MNEPRDRPRVAAWVALTDDPPKTTKELHEIDNETARIGNAYIGHVDHRLRRKDNTTNGGIPDDSCGL